MPSFRHLCFSSTLVSTTSPPLDRSGLLSAWESSFRRSFPVCRTHPNCHLPTSTVAIILPVCFLCSTLQLSPVFVEAPIDIVSSASLDGLIPQVCPAAVESNVIGAPRIDEVDYIRTHPSP
jgi:hypothetical protein